MAKTIGSGVALLRVATMLVLIAATPAIHAAVIHSAHVSSNLSLLVTRHGFVGHAFTDTITRTLTRSVEQFDIAGAVLLSAGVGFTFDVTSDGFLAKPPGIIDLSTGGQQFAQDQLSGASNTGSCLTATTTIVNCDVAFVSHNFFFGVNPADWGIIMGFGTFDVSDAGIARFVGGCFEGASANGTCANDATFTHDGIFDLNFARLEFNYCIPGQEISTGQLCPAAIPGVNSPMEGTSGSGGTIGLITVPEPATLALLSVGLAGLGFSRRKQ